MMRKIAAVTSVVAVVALAAGCGNSSSSSGGGDKVIKLMAIGPIQSQILSYPQGGDAVKAAVKEINAAGGIKGHKVSVEVCNDQSDPSVASDCARKAVADQVTAVVGFFSIQDTQILPILAAAKIPWIGNSAASTASYTSKASFPINSGAGGIAPQAQVLADKAGVKKVVVIQSETPLNKQSYQFFQLGAKQAGSDIVGNIIVPPNTIDMAPYVKRIMALKPDGIMTNLTYQDSPKLWSEFKAQNIKIPLSADLGGLPPATVTAAGDATDGFLFVKPFPDGSSQVAGLDDFRATMKKYSPKTILDVTAVETWASVHVLKDIITSQNVTDPTGPTVFAAANKATLTFGFLKGITYAGKGPFSEAPRIRTLGGEVIKFEGGKPTADGRVDLIAKK